MKTKTVILLLLLGVFSSTPTGAADKAEEALRAVVKIRAVIPEGAWTARVLGTEREGHGIVIDAKGHILTTGYLIIESESIEVTGPDGSKTTAGFVGYDPVSGFGILRAESPLNVAPMPLGNPAELAEGAPVIVAGHGGVGAAAGARVVARREFVGTWEYVLDNAIYTFPAHPEFAGAALIGPDGRLLGVGSLFTRLEVPGLGFLPCNVFIPVDLLTPVLSDLISTGRPRASERPWMGLNADESHGRVFITRITEGGPAGQAGLQAEDLVLKVNGLTVKGLGDFFRKVWAAGSAGVEISLSILTGDEIREVRLRTGDRSKFLLMRPRKSI